MRGLVCLFLALLAGCAAEGTEELACSNLCECVSFGVIAENQCNSDCVALLDGQIAVDQACLDCVSFSTCDELGDNDACELECQNVQSLELP